MAKRDEGWTTIWLKGSTEAFHVAASEHDALLADWMSGKAFRQTRDCYGDPVTLKLGEVVAVGRCTPEGYTRWRQVQREEREEMRQERLLGGEHDGDDD